MVYDDIFAGIAGARPVANYAPRLEIGKHTVALKRFRVKPSQKGGGPILEADFVVMASSVHQPGEVRGWPWFISGQGFSGAYEQARAQEFIAAIAKSIGDTRDVKAVGADLAGDAQPGRGIVLEVEIAPKLHKGKTYTNAYWTAVAQDGAMIAQTRAMVEQAVAPAPQAQQPQGLPVSGPPATASGGPTGNPLTALLTGLKR